MSGRRSRAPPSRGAESTQKPVEVATARQTRSTAKRAEVTIVAPESESPKNQSKIPQRGTRRGHRRSLESVATNDFAKSSTDYASPERPAGDIPPSSDVETIENTDHATAAVAISATDNAAEDSQSESDDDMSSVVLQDVLEYVLPRLSGWCERTYEALAAVKRPEATAQDLKRLKSTKKLFEDARRMMPGNEGPYINLSSSGLPAADGSDAHARIEAAVLSANLVSLLLSLKDVRDSRKDLLYFLQEVDEAIPLFEASLLDRSESSSMRFRVRCGRLVELVNSTPNMAPLKLACVLFCGLPANSAETPAEAKEQLKTALCEGFRDMDQEGGSTWTEAGVAPIEEMMDTLSLPDWEQAAEDLTKLLYPQDELLGMLQTWAEAAYAQIQAMVKLVEQAVHEPEAAIEREEGDKSGRERSVPLLALEADEADEESDSESISEEGGYEKLQTVSKEPSFIRDTAALAAVRRSEQQSRVNEPTESQTIYAIRQLRPSQIFGSTAAAAAERPGPASPSHSAESQELGTSQKRGRRVAEAERDYSPGDDEEEEETEDRGSRQGTYHDDQTDAFEVNRQVIDESRRIRPDSSTVARPAPKRSRTTRPPLTSTARPVLPAPPAASDPRNTDLATLSQAVRENRTANRPRAPQARVRWTDAETRRLLDLMAKEETSCQWAAMEKAGGFRVDRNQQAIRDRARNLKKWYLCADHNLPLGFDGVYLGKKEREEIIAAGRNPDRQEDDVAEDGTITNYLWPED